MILRKRVKRGTRLDNVDLEPRLKKPILFLLSSSHNQDSKQLLKDLYQIFKEFSTFRQNHKSNQTTSTNKLASDSSVNVLINGRNHRECELICGKLGFGLYVVASSNKKRPISIGFGRMYNRKILDLCQLKVLQYKPTQHFNQLDVELNSRPLIVVQGSGFGQQKGHLTTVRNILLDIFKGPTHTKISLDNIKHLITITLIDQSNSSNTVDTTNTMDNEESVEVERRKVYKNGPKVLFRRYLITLLKPKKLEHNHSNTMLPRVSLSEIGPSIDFELEEVLESDPSVLKSATLLPRGPKKLIAGVAGVKKLKKSKNVKTTTLGTTEGKVYINQQPLNQLHTHHH
ncbi:Brix domain protein [Theileria parva strain Muguga]|uniref:Ribosome production factor 2 homolog n=1 Tax=Theileria parva TaxID=5875 RepID=Q4N8A6_THEPA|nr:Brix domain protein [Theileria parva strain Muguga]EAN33802.1 Brix domain protein [Theileria parva strain Muguga]|eukprot:XP_766085.1 hypothetical protein [Theileria parva strain Muguga]